MLKSTVAACCPPEVHHIPLGWGHSGRLFFTSVRRPRRGAAVPSVVPCCTETVSLAVKLTEGHGPGVNGSPPGRLDVAGFWDRARDDRAVGRVPADPPGARAGAAGKRQPGLIE